MKKEHVSVTVGPAIIVQFRTKNGVHKVLISIPDTFADLQRDIDRLWLTIEKLDQDDAG